MIPKASDTVKKTMITGKTEWVTDAGHRVIVERTNETTRIDLVLDVRKDISVSADHVTFHFGADLDAVHDLSEILRQAAFTAGFKVKRG